MKQDALTFGHIILEARKKKGYTLRECAALILKEDNTHISFPYLNDLENGRRLPSEHIIKQLSAVLDIPLEYLYFYAEIFPKGLNKNASQDRIISAYKSFVESLR
jgi:transcriptional regulator with XRE-family HTH domain